MSFCLACEGKAKKDDIGGAFIEPLEVRSEFDGCEYVNLHSATTSKSTHCFKSIQMTVNYFKG